MAYTVKISGYQIPTYTEPDPLKYGKLATKYLSIYGYFYSVVMNPVDCWRPYAECQSKPYRMMNHESNVDKQLKDPGLGGLLSTIISTNGN